MQFYEHQQTKKKWWRLAPKSGRWRLAGLYYRRAVPVARKVRKIAFFVNQSTPHSSDMAPGGNQCAARRFLQFQEPQPYSLHLRALTNPQLLCFPLIFRFKGYTHRFKIMVRSYGSHYTKTPYIISFNLVSQ